MNRRITGVVGVAAGLGLAATAIGGPVHAAPAADPTVSALGKADDRPEPLAEKRRALKQKAVDLVVNGQAKVQQRGGSQAVKIAPGQWVEYGVEETAQLFSILIEFGDQVDPRFPNEPAGPVHNTIPEPGADDNSTYWVEDFNRDHFMDMFFGEGESFHGVYKEMSSGRFDLQGDVTDWVTVPYNSASYGQTESYRDMCRFVNDGADAWWNAEIAKGKTPEEVTAYLERFDVWDRYDHDGDGDFAEADGYIDHFQAIHAGVGEEAGGPESSIWSHRWAACYADAVGPEGWEIGGVEIGDSGLWIRDYTTEPENGGLGVFAHEFAHDLGLPDYYDTGGGENSTAFWTLMSSGSWLGHGEGTIGTTPNHMGAHEKLFLGWLDYETVAAGETEKVVLGPSYHATKNPQAVIVNLPAGEHHEVVAAPYDGEFLYSGTGDDRDASATAQFAVPEGGSLSAKVLYEIEADWDYQYVEVSDNGGASFTPIETNLSTSTNPNGSNLGHGITGSSDGEWVDLTADLASYAGKTVQIRFRHVNDAATHELGFAVDDLTVGGATEDFSDTSEWTLDGFYATDAEGGITRAFEHYYIAENRVYGGYDSTLRTGPYNFGWPLTAPDKVEHFPYQDGLLITYVNSLYGDNNVSSHPGAGQALPVDAHPEAMTWSDGTVVRNRIQAYDATFGLQATDPLSLHRETEAGMTTLEQESQPAVPVFDDSDPYAYYDEANPQGSVIVGGTGTTIAVVKQHPNKGTMTVQVN